MKKEYIAPQSSVVALNINSLLFVASVDGNEEINGAVGVKDASPFCDDLFEDDEP